MGKEDETLKLGLIVNPVAGLGGRVGLKGTDGLSEVALKRGAVPLSGQRTVRALKRLAPHRHHISIIAAQGAMGQAAASEAGLLTEVLTTPTPNKTSANDTQAAVREMLEGGVDLILFAGGDGTARDIFAIAGDTVPMLGIPTGVKMQSGVFATSPEAAGDIVASLVETADRDRIQFRQSEVMDIDEAELRKGTISPKLFGYARVPSVSTLLQNAKARNRSLDEGALPSAALQIAEEMEPGVLYAVGPGRSTQHLLHALKLDGTLLGTDLVLDRKLLARDVDERAILEASQKRPLKIIVGVIGGQGYVFGRGNQELSPAVIRRAGKDGITILSAQAKLLALPDKRLLVDTGEPALDEELAGYWRVMVGAQEYMMMKLARA